VAAIGELAHRRGALFFLDAIQGVGAFPLDLSQSPVDFLAADGHKWMLGPEGAGLFYVRREHLDRLRPLGIGWNSVTSSGDYAKHDLTLKPNAGRYEGGTYNTGGLAALADSLSCLLDAGIEHLGRRILEVTDELCERLVGLGAEIASCRDGERRSGIVAFTLPGRDPQEVKRRLLDAGVVVTCRNGRIRCSPHAYTNDDDLDRLVDGLRKIVTE
jgi:selenocysteine lyase/cysteine desulfurase